MMSAGNNGANSIDSSTINELFGRDLSTPTVCAKCGSAELEFKGLGEYECKDCHYKMYDDYGKVREYLDAHRGANQAEVSQATGVSINKIRQFLRDERIEIAPNSLIFIHCESCHKQITSGRFCPKCEAQRAKMAASIDGRKTMKNASGVGMGSKSDSGQKRFERKR